MELSELDKKMIEVIDMLKEFEGKERLHNTIEFTLSILAGMVDSVKPNTSAEVRLILWESFSTMMISKSDMSMTQKELRK